MMSTVADRKRISDVQDHLGYWLRFVSNAVSHGFAARLEKRGVSAGEWVVLRVLLAREPMMSSRIAEELGMTRGGITKLADRLLAKGWIVRVPSPTDGRVQMLSLTRAGSRLVPSLAALADENDEFFFRHLTKAERDTLEALLKKLIAGAGQSTVPID
jgi:DNA-binding MarR family transcriptional regulator